MPAFEQGPIRPPSEANSLLIRVSRNCPWNRCAFCPVYKGTKFSFRSLKEVLADCDAMQKVYGDSPRTVFLQDANPLLTKFDDLLSLLEGIRKRFPYVERITAYARSHTLQKRSLTDLKRLREAGLNRIHVGLESGCNEVLQLIQKGVSRERQIEAGQRIKAAGFELSEYVMPGLGGRRFSKQNAEDTASAIKAIQPDFIRLRSTTIMPGTTLADMVENNEFKPLNDTEMVTEIRSFIDNLDELDVRLESDHMMNLLMELKGPVASTSTELLDICDRFLDLSEDQKKLFILAKRLNWLGHLDDFDSQAIEQRLEELKKQLINQGYSLDELIKYLQLRY